MMNISEQSHEDDDDCMSHPLIVLINKDDDDGNTMNKATGRTHMINKNNNHANTNNHNNTANDHDYYYSSRTDDDDEDNNNHYFLDKQIGIDVSKKKDIKKKILCGIIFLLISFVYFLFVASTRNSISSSTTTATTFINGNNNDKSEYDDEHDNDHTNGPTALSIFDETTNQFVPVANNPLYNLFHSASSSSSSSSNIVVHENVLSDTSYGSFQLSLDKERMNSFHEPLQLSWSWSPWDKSIHNTNSSRTTTNSNNNNDRNDGVHDDDILTLYCQSALSSFKIRNKEETFDYTKNIRDVATIAQARSSSRFHRHQHLNLQVQEEEKQQEQQRRGRELNENTWYIPSFPTIREETCHFRLWRNVNININNHIHPMKQNVLQLLAISKDLHLPAQNTPTGIHLSLTNSPNEMVVQYTTGLNGTPLVEVKASTNNNSTVSIIYQGSSTTYTNEDMCQKPANSIKIGCFIPPGNLHTVLLTNLTPDTEYTYRVGLKVTDDINDEENFSNEYHSFVTIPQIGSTNPFAFIAYGDQGCPVDGWAMGGNMSTNMVKRELDNAIIPIKAVHHFGDLSYAKGHAHSWDDWLDMISIFSTRVPLLVGIGNHEYDHTKGGKGKDPSGETSAGGFRPIWGDFFTDSGGECGVPTSKRFYTPPNGNGVFWYSYDMGPVHTIMISSEHSLRKNSRQYQWLENDLQNIDRSITPWIILESHRPMYMNEMIEKSVEIGMRHEFEHLLIEYNVDLFLAGHFHAYHRTCGGLYKSKCNNGGLTHITVGTAGAKLYEGKPSFSKLSEVLLKEWGYGKVTVYNSSCIHWSFIPSHGENEGKVMDELWMTKDV